MMTSPPCDICLAPSRFYATARDPDGNPCWHCDNCTVSAGEIDNEPAANRGRPHEAITSLASTGLTSCSSDGAAGSASMAGGGA